MTRDVHHRTFSVIDHRARERKRAGELGDQKAKVAQLGLNVQDLPGAVGLTGDIGSQFGVGKARAVDAQLAVLQIQIGGKAALPGQKPIHLGIAKAKALAGGGGRDMGAVQGAGEPNLGGCGAAIAAAQ